LAGRRAEALKEPWGRIETRERAFRDFCLIPKSGASTVVRMRRTYHLFLRRTLRSCVAACLACALSGAAFGQLEPGTGPASIDGRSELEKVRDEFLAVKAALEAAQAEALQRLEVKTAVAEVSEAMEEAMLAQAPDRSDTITMYFDKQEMLAGLGGGAAGNRETLAQEVKLLRAELKDLMAAASDSAAVRQAQNESRRAILAAMKEVNPKTDELLQKQNELMQRYRELQQRAK